MNAFKSESEIIQNIMELILFMSVSYVSFALIMMSITWPLFKFKQDVQRLSSNVVIFSSKSMKDDCTNNLTIVSNLETLKITMRDCIAHEEGYYLFLNYLIKEFSIENLLV